MDEKEFHGLADALLAALEDDLEEADQEGSLDMEIAGGVMTLSLPGGRQFVISKHAPTRQIWLSSPISGGHHFSYDTASRQWRLPDGRDFKNLLDAELAEISIIRSLDE